MGLCKQFTTDCIYTDRDNDDYCTSDTCKYNIEIEYDWDTGTFITRDIKTMRHKKNGKRK